MRRRECRDIRTEDLMHDLVGDEITMVNGSGNLLAKQRARSDFGAEQRTGRNDIEGQ